MSESDSCKIAEILGYLEALYGRLDWWRGTPEEIMIGAILTQQTRWENVERAIIALKAKNLTDMEGIHRVDRSVIEESIRCTGFYRVKTNRLKALASLVLSLGGVERMGSMTTGALREKLLGVKGIGEETADSILCYAFSRPTFVIDAYTVRICACAGIGAKRAELLRLFQNALPGEVRVYQQAHAQIVEFAKERCTRRRCDGCRIKGLNG